MCHCEITLFSHLFPIIFILFLHFGVQNPGPGPKAAAGQARPGPRAAALGPRPGSRAPKCENFHVFITFLGSGPRSGPQKSYFRHIPGHIFFIFLLKPSFPACPYGQSLQL